MKSSMWWKHVFICNKEGHWKQTPLWRKIERKRCHLYIMMKKNKYWRQGEIKCETWKIIFGLLKASIDNYWIVALRPILWSGLVEVSKLRPPVTTCWCHLRCFLWNSNHMFPSSCKNFYTTSMQLEWKLINSKGALIFCFVNIVISRQWTRMLCGENSYLSHNYECKKWGLHFRSNDEGIRSKAIFSSMLRNPKS
jgi:hypothetical protein